jgi:hypothetical protein
VLAVVGSRVMYDSNLFGSCRNLQQEGSRCAQTDITS